MVWRLVIFKFFLDLKYVPIDTSAEQKSLSWGWNECVTGAVLPHTLCSFDGFCLVSKGLVYPFLSDLLLPSFIIITFFLWCRISYPSPQIRGTETTVTYRHVCAIQHEQMLHVVTLLHTWTCFLKLIFFSVDTSNVADTTAGVSSIHTSNTCIVSC